MNVKRFDPHSAEPVSTQSWGGVVSLGKFDGVHLGHLHILRRVKEHATRLAVPAIAITFDPSPVAVLNPGHQPPVLCTLEQKAERIAASGMDTLLVVAPDRKMLQWTPEQFFRNVFLDRLNASVIVEGDNFSFGNNRSGNADTIRRLCREYGRTAEILPPIRVEGNDVSSSRIRALLREGNVETARTMLARPYRIAGKVVHGEHRGRTLGFPTANLDDVPTLLPKPGIYACSCTVEGRTYPTALHLGINPTFHEERLKIEAHLIGFEGDLYGRSLEIDFFAFLREIRKFDSADELIAQMKEDVRRSCE